MKVIGIKKYDFQNQQSERISGVQLLVVEVSTIESVRGHQWDILKFSIDKFNDVLQKIGNVDLLNKEVTPIYNKYGRVEQLLLVK